MEEQCVKNTNIEGNNVGEFRGVGKVRAQIFLHSIVLFFLNRYRKKSRKINTWI